MSYDPTSGLAFIPYIQTGATFKKAPMEEEAVRHPIHPDALRVGVSAEEIIDPKDPMDGRGSLIAWNVRTQAIEWRVDYPSFWNGGTLVTKGGLVFQGLE